MNNALSILQEADRVRRQLAPGAKSDHITFLNAYLGWLAAKRSGNVRQRRLDSVLKKA